MITVHPAATVDIHPQSCKWGANAGKGIMCEVSRENACHWLSRRP
jgi:hypothetical protein